MGETKGWNHIGIASCQVIFPLGFKDDVHNAPDNDDDYGYDSFGNLTADQNKHISQIKYNHLNLPVEIDFDFPTESKITYIYAADGSKVGKTVLHGNTVEEHYLDGFRYRNGKMQHFATSEGYVSVTQVENGTNRYNYVYNYLDHLGNIRLSYGVDPRDNALKILEENHYYPYGLKHANYNTERNEYKKDGADEGGSVALKTPDNPDEATEKYKYKFNGMEWQSELGVNLYDMDMRDYDPATAKWMGIDPVANFEQSPYFAFDGNPVVNADPSGAYSVSDTLNWQANQAYLNNSLGSSSSWGQSLVGGNPNDYIEDLASNAVAYSTSNSSEINSMYNHYAKQFGYSTFRVTAGPVQRGAGVVNWFNKAEDGALWELADNDTTYEKGALTIYTHGNTNLILGPNKEIIQTLAQLNSFLSKESDDWNNFIKNGGNFKLTLMSCYTGALGSKSNQGFTTNRNVARDFTYDANRLNRNLTVIAPSGAIMAFRLFGPHYFQWDNQGKYEWNVYNSGRRIGGYDN